MLLVWLWLDVSYAADAPVNSMSTVLMLLGIVSSAYLLTHFVIERAQQRFLFVSGVEYILLGVVLGPHVLPEIAPFSDLTQLAPIFAFAAGWVGLLYGLELTRTVDLGGQPIWHAMVDAAMTGALVTGAALWFFQLDLVGGGSTDLNPLGAALLLGCTAAASSGSAVDLLQSRYGDLVTQLLPLLRRTAWCGSLIGIIGFGTLFCLYHQGSAFTALPVQWWGWLLLTFGLGVVLGMLFWMFIGSDPDENSVFLAMVGILLFASGAAFFLNLSALLVNLTLGIVLALTPHGQSVRGQIERTASPARLVLLLFAGAHWRPVHPVAGILVVLGYVVLRLLGKSVSSVIATLGTPLRFDLFRGLMAQGDVAVAMALSFRLIYEGPTVDLAYTAVLASVILHEIVSPRMLRGLLVDAGELREDLGPGLSGRGQASFTPVTVARTMSQRSTDGGAP